MLSLTKKTEYAIIAVCHLARARGKVSSARNIARNYSVRLPLLMNVLKSLNQGGLLSSVRGARGGYRLAAAPATITLASLIEAVEAPVRLVKCAPPRRQAELNCELSGACPIRVPVQKVHRKLRGVLDQITVADLAFDDGFLEVRRVAPALGVVGE